MLEAVLFDKARTSSDILTTNARRRNRHL